uniref:Uncharacterized protein n=1 Tax=Salix viminalis TaxID=40686 RepID=A0A6N2KSG6_SALVM
MAYVKDPSLPPPSSNPTEMNSQFRKGSCDKTSTKRGKVSEIETLPDQALKLPRIPMLQNVSAGLSWLEFCSPEVASRWNKSKLRIWVQRDRNYGRKWSPHLM